jgi:hypothetical protein
MQGAREARECPPPQLGHEELREVGERLAELGDTEIAALVRACRAGAAPCAARATPAGVSRRALASGRGAGHAAGPCDRPDRSAAAFDADRTRGPKRARG